MLVDADSHVTESLGDILPYMGERHEGIRKMIELSAMPMSDAFSITAPTPIFAHINQSEDVEVLVDAERVATVERSRENDGHTEYGPAVLEFETAVRSAVDADGPVDEEPASDR